MGCPSNHPTNPIIQSSNQPIIQPANQPTSQPADEPTNGPQILFIEKLNVMNLRGCRIRGYSSVRTHPREHARAHLRKDNHMYVHACANQPSTAALHQQPTHLAWTTAGRSGEPICEATKIYIIHGQNKIIRVRTNSRRKKRRPAYQHISISAYPLADQQASSQVTKFLTHLLTQSLTRSLTQWSIQLSIHSLIHPQTK